MTRIKPPPPIKIGRPGLSLSEARRVGGYAIAIMVRRVRQLHKGSDDRPFKPYSPRGPIYVPLTGPGRTKTVLRGREIITRRDLRLMRRVREVYVTKTRKSVKFRNYADYKRALGKSGLRDLELSGRMLGAITIVQSTPNRVTLGFTREQEHLKAMGNEERTPWFGLSENDVTRLTPLVETLLAAKWKLRNRR